jgi:uncharacterized glyoxalase superfamily protein PhnB
MEHKATFKQVIPVIFVEDLDAATKYYVEKLGFQVSFTSEWDYNGVSRDGMELHIGRGTTSLVNTQGAHIYFSVENVDALRLEFIRSGAIGADTQVVDMPYGAREIHVRDVFGYHLGFSEPIKG